MRGGPPRAIVRVTSGDVLDVLVGEAVIPAVNNVPLMYTWSYGYKIGLRRVARYCAWPSGSLK